MSEQKFSDFTLNFNPGARGNEKAPTLKGKSTVRDGGNATEFDVAAWGPNKASTGGPDFYNVTFTPKDPALAARQLKTVLKPEEVPNPIDGFELKMLGSGRMFERSDDELKRAAAQSKQLPKFYGHVLVLTVAGPRAVDLSAWHRPEHNFYSGNAKLHDPEAAASARAAAGRPARAPRPQHG